MNIWSGYLQSKSCRFIDYLGFLNFNQSIEPPEPRAEVEKGELRPEVVVDCELRGGDAIVV